MRIIDAKQCTAIALGRLGENDYTVVRFDVSAWLNELPGAVIGLYNQRPGDGAAYPVAGITVDGGIATWTVTSAELTQTGEGRCELVAIAGEVVAKSAIFRTIVFDALDGSGETPEPWADWQQQFIILKGEAEQAADRAEEAVEHYPRIVDGVWEVWDAQTGAFVSTGVQAQGPQGVPGEQGDPGEPGADGVTFTPAVSSDGIISWTNDGGKTNPQPVNIKGPQGDDYILTSADKEEIAQQTAASLAPVLDEKAAAIHTAAGPAPIVSIPDAAAAPVDALTVVVEPVQDLHGYESPWPAGGGKNLLEITATTQTVRGVTFTVNSDGTVNVNGTASAKILFPIGSINLTGNVSYKLNGCPSGGSVNSYAMYDNISGFKDYGSGSTYTPTEDKTEVPIRIEIQSGVTVSNQLFKPMIRLSSVSDATFAPYKNECPITGWTGCEIDRVGVNFGYLTENNVVSHQRDSVVYTSNGVTVTSTDIYGRTGFSMKVIPGQQYTLSFKCKKTGSAYAIQFNHENAFSYNYWVIVPTDTLTEYTRTITTTTDVFFVGIYPKAQGSSITVEDFQLELGSTATAYEPYQDETYHITFPSEAGTVYGGSLTIAEDGSGVLTVDMKMVDLGTLTWYKIATTGSHWRFWAYLNDMAYGGEMLSSQYKHITATQSYMGEIGIASQSSGSNYLAMVTDERFSDTDTFKTAMSGVQLVYELATPITYTLTPQEIRTLLGANNIWADAGPVDVEYRADTKLYIGNKITQAIAAALNSAD